MNVPHVDIHEIPRRVYIHNEVVDCGESGEPEDDIPKRVYFAINDTSGKLYPVEVTKLLCVTCKHAHYTT